MERAKPAPGSRSGTGPSSQLDSAKLAAKLKSLPYSFSQQMPAPQKKSQFEREYPQLARPHAAPLSLSEMVNASPPNVISPARTGSSSAGTGLGPGARAGSGAGSTSASSQSPAANKPLLISKYNNAMQPPSHSPTPPPPSNNGAAAAGASLGKSRVVCPSDGKTRFSSPDSHGVSSPRLQGMWDPSVRQKSANEQRGLAAMQQARGEHQEDEADLVFLSKLIPTTSATPRPANHPAIGRKSHVRSVPTSSHPLADKPAVSIANGLRTVAPPPPPAVSTADRDLPSLPRPANNNPNAVLPNSAKDSSRKRDLPTAKPIKPPQDPIVVPVASGAADKKQPGGRLIASPSNDLTARRPPSSPVNSRAAGFRDAIKLSNSKDRDVSKSARRQQNGTEMPEAMLSRVVSSPKPDDAVLLVPETVRVCEPVVSEPQTGLGESHAFSEDDVCTFFLPAGLGLENGSTH